MEDSYEYDEFEGKTTEKSALIGLPSSSAPPAYEGEPPATAQLPNLKPPDQPHSQIEMGQSHDPQQLHVHNIQVGEALPQIWPQGSPVSSINLKLVASAITTWLEIHLLVY